MTNIDWSARVSVADQNAVAMAAHRAAVKAECSRRLRAAASIETQLNLAAQYVNFTLYETGAYTEFLTWVAAMRAHCTTLSEDINVDPAAATWPILPAHVNSLLENY